MQPGIPGQRPAVSVVLARGRAPGDAGEEGGDGGTGPIWSFPGRIWVSRSGPIQGPIWVVRACLCCSCRGATAACAAGSRPCMEGEVDGELRSWPGEVVRSALVRAGRHRGPRQFGYDIEVLRRRRGEQHGRLPQSGGLGGRCAAIQTKVLQRRRPWVSFPSLEALPRCRHLARSLSGLVRVSGRKPWSGVGSARWRRPRRRHSVGSIASGDTAWRFQVALLRCSLLSKIELQGRNARHRWHVRVVALLGPTKSRHCSSDDGALARGVQVKPRPSEVPNIG